MKRLYPFCMLMLCLGVMLIPLNAQNKLPFLSSQKEPNPFEFIVDNDLWEVHTTFSSYEKGAAELENYKKNHPLFLFNEEYITVDLIANGDIELLMKELNSLDFSISGYFANMVSGEIKIDQIDELTKLEHLKYVSPVLVTTHSGPVNSQGDSAQISDLARQLNGFDGAGIKIGIISNSYNQLGGAAAGVAAGELPGPGNPNGYTIPVNVLLDDLSCNSSNPTCDEGRAMAENCSRHCPWSSNLFPNRICRGSSIC